MNTIIVNGMGTRVKLLLDNTNFVSEHSLRAAFQLEQDVPIGMFMTVEGEKIFLSQKEEQKTRYFSLPEGWKTVEFGLIWEEARRSRTQIDMPSTSVAEIGSKRKRICDEQPMDVKEEGFIVKRCREFMLYFLLERGCSGEFIEGSVRKCATVFSEKFALAAGHCIPDGLPSEYPFNLYDNSGNTYVVNAVRVYKSGVQNDDYAILKITEGIFANFPKGLALPCSGERYFVLGYDAEYPNVFYLSCFSGRFRNTKIYANQSYVIGSPGTTDGCSGGGVFDKFGDLFGICVSGKLDLTNVNTTLTGHLNSLTLKLGQPSYSHIVPAFYCMAIINAL